MKKFRNLIAIFTLAIGLGLSFVPATTAAASSLIGSVSTICDDTDSSSSVCQHTGDSVTDIVQNIINILLYVVGILAVIMIIYGGIRYTTSAGNEKAVTSAKSTIMYAIIGLVVAVLAYAIVSFVFNAISAKHTDSHGCTTEQSWNSTSKKCVAK